MNTGQLCSHGTRDALGAKDEKAEKWMTAARKYNEAIKEATAALMADAAGILDEKQMELLQAWFEKGFNKEINQLLYSKGLGGVGGQTASDAEHKH